MKQIYLLDPIEREKECTEHSFIYTGQMPCTGLQRCHKCGYIKEYDEEKHNSKELIS